MHLDFTLEIPNSNFSSKLLMTWPWPRIDSMFSCGYADKPVVALRVHPCNHLLCPECASHVVTATFSMCPSVKHNSASSRPPVHAPPFSDLDLVRWRVFHISSANLRNVRKVVYDDSGEGMLELVIGIWTGSSDDAIDTVRR